MVTIRAEFPEARSIVPATFEGDVEIQRALEAGTRGYALMCMPPSGLAKTIHHVHSGKGARVAARLEEHTSVEN